MLDIQSSMMAFFRGSFNPQNPSHHSITRTGSFEALLANFDTLSTSSTHNSRAVSVLSHSDPLYGFVESLLEHMTNSLNDRLGVNPQDPITLRTFNFTDAFDFTFGTRGPLPDFIRRVTKELGLSTVQNQALQTIAVQNKDITKTPENIQKIAAELQQAGIGYALQSDLGTSV